MTTLFKNTKALVITAFIGCIVGNTPIYALEIDFTRHTLDEAFDSANDVLLQDFDQDGDVDILAVARRDSAIAVWENDGTQNFTKRVLITFANANALASADIDNDGDLDIIAGSFSGSAQVAWWENDGTQNFTNKHVLIEGLSAFEIVVTDLDSDGDTDFLITSPSDDTITWLKNNGDQNFVNHTISDTFDGAFKSTAIDLDHDGDRDVVGVAVLQDALAWWENDGFQNFTQQILSGDLRGASDVLAIDIDFDGDLDLATTAGDLHELAWWENDGQRNYTKQVLDNSLLGAAGVDAADLDADGDIDLIGIGERGDILAWWENNGAQTFTKRVIDDFIDGAADIDLGDIDNDGDIDIAAVGFAGDVVAWWQNGLPPLTLEPDILIVAEALDFGDIVQGTQQTRSLLIQNKGRDTLRISSITTTGPFGVNDATLVLPPLAKQDISITFAPTDTGTASGILTLLSNDPDLSTAQLVLQGRGVLAPNIRVSPQALNSTLNVNADTSATLNIENTGAGDLIYAITVQSPDLDIAIPDSIAFNKNELPGEPIPDRGSTTSTLEITESFSIQDIRVFVSILHGFRGDLVVSLTSPTGTTVILHNRTGGLASDLIGTFGTQALQPAQSLSNFRGQSSRGTWTLTVEDGEAGIVGTLNLWRIEFLNSNIPLITSISPDTGRIAPGSNQAVAIGLQAPPLGGTFQADLVINNNDPDANPVQVPVQIQAQGTPSIRSSIPDLLDFNNVQQGAQDTLSVFAYNDGSDSLRIAADLSAEQNPFHASPAQLVIAPRDSQQIAFTFSPTDLGFYVDKVTLTHNDPTSAPIEITLQGQSVVPTDIAVTPQAFEFNLVQGETERDTLLISNPSDGNLVIHIQTIDSINTIQSVAPLKILAWTGEVDRPSFDTVQNILADSDIRFDLKTTTVTDPIDLQQELTQTDLFLIPAQTISGSFLGLDWSEVLLNFAEKGGTILGLSQRGFLNAAGLIELSAGSDASIAMRINELNHPIAADIPETFSSTFFTRESFTTNGTIIISANSEPTAGTAIVRTIGAGQAIWLGQAFSQPNETFGQILINAIKTLTGDNLITVSTRTDTVPGGGQHLAIVAAHSHGPTGQHHALIRITSNVPDPTKSQIDIPVDIIIRSRSILGDVNNDNIVNILDALIVASYAADTTTVIPNNGNILSGDVNVDGHIDISDAISIAIYDIDPTHTNLPEGIGKPYVLPLSKSLASARAPLYPSQFDNNIVIRPGATFQVNISVHHAPEPMSGYAAQVLWNPEHMHYQNHQFDFEWSHLEAQAKATTEKLSFYQLSPQNPSVSGDLITITYRANQELSIAELQDIQLQGTILGSETLVNLITPSRAPNLIHWQVVPALPTAFDLAQNYPNPFNPETQIWYAIPQDHNRPSSIAVRLDIYNALGQHIRTLVDENQNPGNYRMTWDGTNQKGQPVASGLYFYAIRAGNFSDIKKMILLK